MDELYPVMVYWTDSMGTPGWGEFAEASMSCISVGHLFDENERCIVLAMNRTRYQHGDYIQIPRSAIQHITPLLRPEQVLIPLSDVH